MNKSIKELCRVIGRDLSKLHKGDTASALWPFTSNEAEYYVGSFFIKEIYSIIKILKLRGYTEEKIAKLFCTPSKIAQYFTLFHSAKILKKEERLELAEDLVSYISYYREDLLCEKTNRLKKYSFDSNNLSLEKENIIMSNKISALLLLYLEIIYPTMMRLGHEFHGVYEEGNRRFFVKEFFNLDPISLGIKDKFPFKNIKIVEEIEGEIELDFFNHLFKSPNKKSTYVEIEGRVVSGGKLREVYGEIEDKIKSIINRTKYFSRKDWFKVYARGLFNSFDELRKETGHSLEIPIELFKKIDKEDFKIPIKKVIEFTQNHTRKEIEEITTKSYLKIFEENDR